MKPIEHLEVNGTVVRRQPPVVVVYCSTPPTGRAEWPCAYRATTCTDTPQRCQRCHYSFCAKHLPVHERRFLAPPDAWKGIVGRLKASLERAARKAEAGKQNMVRVKVPEVEPDG